MGAGGTLVAELLPRETRGVGTTIIESGGLLGAGLAGLVAKTFDWRTAYFIGGALGLALLALRLGVRESALFQGAASSEVQRGNFFALFRNRRRAIRFLSLVFVGQSHNSSDVHKQVIAELERGGSAQDKLEPIRRCAREAKEALCAGDLPRLGRSMIDNTAAQAALHPELVGVHHRAIIEIARAHHAIGWKVNGAGGEGGSITLLSGPDFAEKRVRSETPASDRPER